ncbi:FKBP-type peptidyl-prolyl cis-trans isomerase SlyD [bioreactor metagenome]|jgi:FKBP-type peptidyl-prolyl cis-trans isomerase SlyD|uniref:peptidylprolyl isomerase n=2 Tax=root TaxID=1 RepID=A0A644TYU4_9ZZZZ
MAFICNFARLFNIVAILFVGSANIQISQKMIISKNKVVSLTYELKLDNAEGEVVDMADAAQPLVFLYGAGNMLPKFESNLAELKANDDFEFTLSSDDAYGPVIEEAVVELPIDIFMVDGKIDPDMLFVGNVIPMQDNEGRPLDGTVVSISDDKVKMDFNHPMAGKTLHFTGKILELREATAEEISHGHVHGPHGHHH